MRNRENTGQKAWVGIALLALGSFFLLRNLNLIPPFIPHYLFGWEMILIIIGGSMLLTGRRKGFILLAIGTFFLLPEIFFWPRFYLRDWWPVILIIIGAMIILRRRDHVLRQSGDSDDDFIEDISVFGGAEKSYSPQNFRGGRLTSVFGGSEINLSSAEIKSDEAILDYFILFGGSGLIIPNDWTVINESFVVFGGFSDKRPTTGEAPNPKKVLRIKGSVVFGGAEIKRV